MPVRPLVGLPVGGATVLDWMGAVLVLDGTTMVEVEVEVEVEVVVVAANAMVARLLRAPDSTATALRPKVAASTPLISSLFNFI